MDIVRHMVCKINRLADVNRIAAALAFAFAATACTEPATKSSAAQNAKPPVAPASAASTPASAAAAAFMTNPGKALYSRDCAACHDQPDQTRSPSFETLTRMSEANIDFALTKGKMQAQGARLNDAERQLLIKYLASNDPSTDEWVGRMMCPADRRSALLEGSPTITGFGYDSQNHRQLSSAQSGLKTADFANLELAWSLGFPKTTAMRAQPAIVGKTLFLTVPDISRLFAIDVSRATPCIHWVYKNTVPLRSSTAYGELPGSKRRVVIFSDLVTTIHMVDAHTGEAIWKRQAGISPLSIITGTPVLHDDKVFVPISLFEGAIAADPKYECCKTHGGVMALDAQTGRPLWLTRAMEPAKPLRDRGDGKKVWGPAGAAIWTSPAIDSKRGVLYVGTGQSFSELVDPNTNSVLAIDLKDGKLRWSFQATKDDIYLYGCSPTTSGPNCPKDYSKSRDFDFGASIMLAKRPDGSDVVLAGQKSGALWAFDPDQSGRVLWRRQIGEGSAHGGIHWGIAQDGVRVFAPISRVKATFSDGRNVDPSHKPGLYAFNIGSGKLEWSFAAQPSCDGERGQRIPNCMTTAIGLSAAPAVIDGAVVTGSIDGVIRAFNAKTGKPLFAFNTVRSFDTLNGVPASGGAIDAASISAGNGYLFVNSGYGLFGQAAGNVMLAFRPKVNR